MVVKIALFRISQPKLVRKSETTMFAELLDLHALELCRLLTSTSGGLVQLSQKRARRSPYSDVFWCSLCRILSRLLAIVKAGLTLIALTVKKYRLRVDSIRSTTLPDLAAMLSFGVQG